MATNKEFDQLVEEVARQVRARLGADSVAPRALGLPVVVDGGVCMATKDNCEGSGACVVRKTPVIEEMIARGASRFSAAPGQVSGVEARTASMIDHTLLKPEATEAEVRKVCEEARKHKFATVCLNSSWIPLASRLLAGSGVKPIAVVGFPLGAATTAAKAFESREAVRSGAGEIDMVINVGALKSKDYAHVLRDIEAVVEASRPAPVKVILETGGLNDEEKVAACALSKAAGAAFVKTSTGFGPGGATVKDIELMRRVVGADMGVKASGGIRSREDFDKMVAAGADRIGASASVAIVQGKVGTSKY
jgi:deoxyribose-phosphate aldolase